MGPNRPEPPGRPAQVAAWAAWHSLAWLVAANAVGVLMATLLLVPDLNRWLGAWTYGRWSMVHLNLQLYGWTSLPVVGFLFRLYGADQGKAAGWCRPVLWCWSAALAVGTLSWLSGHSSGKLFLDWSGPARLILPLAMGTLWLLLALSFLRTGFRAPGPAAAKAAGLALLLAVPFLIHIATGPGSYPPVDPDTGGPTGASQLESSLVVVAMLLVLPFSLAPRRAGRMGPLRLAWIVLAAETLLCVALGRGDVSHRRPVSYLSLGSLLLWLPLMPAYYETFAWSPATRLWRRAMLGWWSLLLVTGWILFLPGVLDHFKFTDGLVGHAHLAMAGFTSSLGIFVLVQLLGTEARVFHRGWSFGAWNGGVLAYVGLMTWAGWREGLDPGFTTVPGPAREAVYALRLLAGLLMLAASLDWLRSASGLVREPAPPVREGAA
jgi:cytochrome c oxidase cbb3-type subunit 1